jgi:hypothetical protein
MRRSASLDSQARVTELVGVTDVVAIGIRRVRASANARRIRYRQCWSKLNRILFRSESCLRALRLIHPQHKHADLQRSSIVSRTAEPSSPPVGRFPSCQLRQCYAIDRLPDTCREI